MGFRSSLACLMAIIAVTTVTCGCGGVRSSATHRAATTTTPSSASWMRLLPFDARVHAPPGAIGIATPEFPGMIVASAESVWVFPHHAELGYRVDPRTNRVAAVVDIGDTPCTTAAAGGGLVWMSNCGPGENSVGWAYGIDPVKDRVALRVRGGDPAFGDGSLWVLDDTGKWVRRVDPRTGVVLAQIATGSDQQPGGGTLVLGGVGYGSAWLDSDADKTVTRISTATNKVTAVIPLVGAKTQAEAFPGYGAGGYIDGAQIAFADGKAWYGNPAGLFEIDARSGQVRLIRLKMRPFAEGGDIPVVAGAGSIWVRTTNTRIDRIDPATGSVLGIYPAARDGGGGGLAVAFGSLWVENVGADSVWREPIKPS
jgi:DNA-binding beta-propeller fold protein YncE